MVAAFVLLPRRAAPALAVVVGVLLVTASAIASREVSNLAEDARHRFFGTSDPSWIDASASGPVTLLFDGGAYWPSVWHQVLWNERVREVVHLPELPVSGPMPQREVSPRFDGLLFDPSGQPVDDAEIVAPTGMTFAGRPVATLAQQDLDRAGLELWRGSVPARLQTITTGVMPNGDFTEARVLVYGCKPGRLELTLLPKAGNQVELIANGQVVERVRIDGDYWNGIIGAPPTADGRSLCEFVVRANDLVGSTRMAYVANS
jgi:hypothetical protein